MRRKTILNSTALQVFALLLCLVTVIPQVAAATYTVAGNDTQALGAEWSPSTASNDMAQYSDNMYYLLKTVTYSSTPSDGYQYKITVDHSWNTSYGVNGGSTNATYKLNAGTGFVCYAFNSSTHVPHVVSSLQTVVIAGDDVTALGSSTWNGSNTANSMTTTDGITYTLTKSLDYTSGGSKQCKAVVAGTDWYGTSSGDNVYYNIAGAGSYTVTYTFNAVTGIVTVDVQAATPVVVNYYVKGDSTVVFTNGWNTGAETLMTDDGNGNYTWETANNVHLYPGTYQYKVYGDNETWYPDGANATFTITTPGTYSVTITFDGTTPNATATLIEADATYDYTFYVLPNDGTTTPYLYLWDANQNKLNGQWPGTAMAQTETLADNNDWYKFEGEFYVNAINAIVNNGGNGHQTADIMGLAPDTYYIHWNVAGNSYTISIEAPTLIVNYYVKGDSTVVFTNGWNTGEETLMTDDGNGNYTWETANNVHLYPGTYNYKVYGDNDTWYPDGDNASFTITTPGTYSVTITFNGTTPTATATLIEADPTYEYTFYVLPNDGTTTLYLYLWDANQNKLNGEWPGTAMAQTETLADNNDWYKFEGEFYVNSVNAIVNNGNNGHQTADIMGLAPDTYYIRWNVEGNSYTISTETPTLIVNYYVKGDSTVVFTNGWNIGAETLMTDDGNGIYTWATANNVHLYPGTYNYKVYGDNDTWYPDGDNASFTITTPGTYSVTITFDGTTPTATATLIEADPTNTFNIYVRYTGNEDVSNVNIHAWDANGDKTSWPGTAFSTLQTTEINGYTYYCVTYTGYASTMNLLFNENGSAQTTDLIANPGDNYYTYGGGSSVSGPNPEPDPAHLFYITGDDGLGLGWSYAPTTTMQYDEESGIFSYTCNITNANTYHFVFATGTGSNWDDFNNHYRVGPTSGEQVVIVGSDWITTQQAGGDHGAYSVSLGVGPCVIYYNPATSMFRVEGVKPVFIEGSTGLGLGWSTTPNQAMDYDATTGYYSYTYNVAKEGVYHFVFADGQVPVVDGNEGAAWNTFNHDYRIGPNGDEDEQAALNEWIDTQHANLEADAPSYSYYAKLGAGEVTIYFDYDNLKFKIQSAGTASPDLFMVGGFTCDSVIYQYGADTGVLMTYDASSNLYYLNNVTLNDGSSFCFTSALGQDSDDWENVGTRYGNNDDDATFYHAPIEEGNIGYYMISSSRINTNLKLHEWSDEMGEWHMATAGVYNVIVNLEDNWVKLVKTDNFALFPMNVYLEQNEYVEIDNVQAPGTAYSPNIFGYNEDDYWPLSAYNRMSGTWHPTAEGRHYSVEYIGDTITSDGKHWWHWQVSASICEVFFTRTNTNYGSQQSPLIERKAGVLWYTWEEDNTLTDHTREYFESSAERLPGNVEVLEEHKYVYFINTVGWETVYITAWNNSGETYYDGNGNDMQSWPGQPMTCIGIDPDTGYEVWVYDFGLIEDTTDPDGLLFNDGNPIATTDAKEQTGDYEFTNGGVYDYLGKFDDAYTLDNIIRIAREEVRYTITNTLLGVYYDKDAKTVISYLDHNNMPQEETIYGALYAKDLEEYSEKSVMPEEDEVTGTKYYDYVYDICASTHTEGGSQIQNKRTYYDQSNWVKLVISPNYDGRQSTPVAQGDRPNLKNYEGCLIPGGTLDVFMTDTINPTAHVLSIGMGEPVDYDPNVYVSVHFNDTVVFSYTHTDWCDKPYKGATKTVPSVTWDYDDEGNVTGGVARPSSTEGPYMFYYVAPKPQEVAYVTWMVYDNPNEDGAYPDYIHGSYSPTTELPSRLPQHPGYFFAPKNWDRSIQIDGADYNYVTENNDGVWGGYGKEYGPYANGYAQYGGVKVNWSLFDAEASGCEWWQIFKPGQAYKFKAIIRYARGSSPGWQPNECYDISNGDPSNYPENTVFNAPRRVVDNEQGNYANLYFTNYDNLEESKFILFPIEASADPSYGNDMGNVTTVKEVQSPRTVVSVRYYNIMGIESNKPFDGLNIIVTTYSDGSRTSKKVMR